MKLSAWQSHPSSLCQYFLHFFFQNVLTTRVWHLSLNQRCSFRWSLNPIRDLHSSHIRSESGWCYACNVSLCLFGWIRSFPRSVTHEADTLCWSHQWSLAKGSALRLRCVPEPSAVECERLGFSRAVCPVPVRPQWNTCSWTHQSFVHRHGRLHWAMPVLHILQIFQSTVLNLSLDMG